MRKPCFECNDHEQDDMSIGECLESPLCTSKDENGCSHINSGKHWEDCGFGARSEEYPAFVYKQNMTQCPCCKGSGLVANEGSIVDEIRGMEWVRDSEAQMIDIESMDRDALIAEIRRLRGENKMLYRMVDDAIAMASSRRIGLLGPDTREHRRCPCGGKPRIKRDETVLWIECDLCQCSTDFYRATVEAWAAWDGVE